MATINLGAIKFKWQGAYNAGTAYTVDDVVSYQGSSYICILASTGNLPTNTTYFEQMSAKGTDGADADLLSISGTVQGDIYYNNGGAIARLGAGTSGQALITNGTGANPTWGDAGGGKVLQVVSSGYDSTSFNTTGTTYVTGGTGVTITPSDTSSKILIMATNTGEIDVGRGYYTIFRGSTNVNGSDELVANQVTGINNPFTMIFLDSPSSTSALTYKIAIRSQNSGNATNASRMTLIALEIGA